MTHQGKKHSLLYALVGLALMLTSTANAGDGGAATIEELVEYCKGVSSLSELVPMIHPDDQPGFGFGIVLVGSFAPMMAMPEDASAEEQEAIGNKLAAEFEALEDKHGLRTPPEDLPSAETPEGMAMRARYMFEGVDIAAFVADVEQWIGGVSGESLTDTMPDFAEIEIGSLQIDGDTATAVMGGSPTEFIREDGRWYLRFEM